MSTILSISAIAVLSALCSVLLKKTNGELSLILSLCGLVLIISAAFGKFEVLIDWIEKIAEGSQLGEILNILMKTLGTSVIANVAIQHCRDCGENGLAFGVELVAKAAVFVTVLPLIDNILLIIEEVLKL